MRRLGVAILAGLAVSVIFAYVALDAVVYYVQESWAKLVPESISDRIYSETLDAIIATAMSLPGIAVAGLIMFTRRRRDSETRCRRCGYILRGISEPRCPECGERI